MGEENKISTKKKETIEYNLKDIHSIPWSREVNISQYIKKDSITLDEIFKKKNDGKTYFIVDIKEKPITRNDGFCNLEDLNLPYEEESQLIKDITEMSEQLEIAKENYYKQIRVTGIILQLIMYLKNNFNLNYKIEKDNGTFYLKKC